jgi:regulator of sigma E protease
MEIMNNLMHAAGPFLLVICILVFFHELGHYLVARWNNVRVEVFSIGFGPELIGWTDNHKTRWKISLIPLGGYVKMLGDADASSRPDLEGLATMAEADKAEALPLKHPRQRIAVSAAGPLANFILAFVLLWGVYGLVGQPVYPPVVGFVQAGGVAEKIGLSVGDRVVSINDQAIERFEQIPLLLRALSDQEVNIQVLRQGEAIQFNLTADMRVTQNNSQIYLLGIGRHDADYVRRSVTEACWQAFVDMGHTITMTLQAIGGIIVGGRSTAELSGPLRIAQLSGQAADIGWIAMLLLMASLSINLGLINLLPIPMLDGGHILFDTVEWIRGRPVREEAKEYAFRFGFLIILAIMLISMWNDLKQLRVVAWIGKLLGFGV